MQAYIYPTMLEGISILACQNMVSVYHENRRHSKPGHTSIHISHYNEGHKYIGTSKLDIP
jgi:hypothetical protein